MMFGLTGCTVFGVKNPPTLGSTTSAEQYERITWANARSQKWNQIEPVLAPNVVYAAQGKLLSRDQVVPYLKSENIRDFVISGLIVKPNGPDMTVTYGLQLSSSDGKTRSLVAVSVWQQLHAGWVLIAHSETPQQN